MAVGNKDATVCGGAAELVVTIAIELLGASGAEETSTVGKVVLLPWVGAARVGVVEAALIGVLT